MYSQLSRKLFLVESDFLNVDAERTVTVEAWVQVTVELELGERELNCAEIRFVQGHERNGTSELGRARFTEGELRCGFFALFRVKRPRPRQSIPLLRVPGDELVTLPISNHSYSDTLVSCRIERESASAHTGKSSVLRYYIS